MIKNSIKCYNCGKSDDVILHIYKTNLYCEDCHPAHNKCVTCNEYFYAVSNRTKYCGHPCYPKTKYPKNELIKRSCDVCGKEYKTIKPNSKYCSNDCKVKKTKHYINTITRFAIFNRDEFRCIYCGKSSMEDGKQLHVDHIIPLFAYGSDMASNLVTSCAQCNVEKSKNILDENVYSRILSIVKSRNLAQKIDENSTIGISYGKAKKI